MKRVVRFLRKAERDVEEARDGYDGQQEGLGVRFAVTVAEAAARLEHDAVPYPIDSGRTRRVVIRGFPCLLLHLVEPDRVVVTGVFHTGRNPHVRAPRVHEAAPAHAAA